MSVRTASSSSHSRNVFGLDREDAIGACRLHRGQWETGAWLASLGRSVNSCGMKGAANRGDPLGTRFRLR
jgi:hypothetical protein